ncbi:MAG: hypothetical protein ACSLE2_08410 [Lysobacterales bacterium]
MNTKIKHTTVTTLILPLLASAALAWPIAASAGGAKALEGTWDVTVTMRNCQTGDAIRSFPRMLTFAKGGTLSEYAAAGTDAMPVARAPGHGAWAFLGDSLFTYSVKFMRLTASGAPDGFISEVRDVAMDHSGDSFTADGRAVITFVNGAQSPVFCATEAGTRLF